MRQQHQMPLEVQPDDEAPQVRYVTRHPLGPCLVPLARLRGLRGILAPVSVTPERRHGRTNIKVARLA